MKFPRAGVMLDAGRVILPDGYAWGKSRFLLFLYVDRRMRQRCGCSTKTGAFCAMV